MEQDLSPEPPPQRGSWAPGRGLCHPSVSPALQESQEQGLQQRLLDEQFAMLRATAAEAERILQDAVGKLDDPLHLRCTSSPGRAARLPTVPPALHPERGGLRAGASAQAPPLTWSPCLADYLVSRAQAALDAVSALEKGHAQYLTSRAGECHMHGTGQRLQAVVPTGHCRLRGATPWSPPTLRAWGPTDPGLIPALLLCSCVPWACPAPRCALGAGLLGPLGLLGGEAVPGLAPRQQC